MAGNAIRAYNYCKNSPSPCKCFNNCPFVCNQSSAITFDPAEPRIKSLFNIYCKLIASNLPNVSQEDLINFTAGTNSPCTLFVRTLDINGNSIFTRLYTTLRDTTTGTYQIDTTLNPSSSAYTAFVSGNSFQGTTTLFGQSYQGLYWKISGKYYAFLGNPL